MGLLDNPNDAAMFAAAAGLLSAGGSSPRPVTFGQALGAAGMNGMQAYQQTQEQGMHNAMRQMQMRQYQDAMAEKQKQQEALANLRNQLPEQMRPMFDVDPVGFLRQMQPKEPEKPQLVTIQTPQGPMQKWVRPGSSDGVEVGAPVDKESALPWYVRKSPDGRMAIDPAYADLEKTKASYGRPPAQPMAPVAYVDDKGQTVWGTIAEAKGRPAANFTPSIQGAIAQAKETGKTMGEETTKAKLDAPRIIQNSETALRLSDELINHPGFKQAVGTSSLLGIQKIPGTDARDFMNRLDQIKGGAFLEAFNSLKGGGQITEVEGKKATDAIARMDNATSEGEFKAAVRDYQDVIRRGMNRAKMKANPVGQVSSPSPAGGGVKFLGFE